MPKLIEVDEEEYTRMNRVYGTLAKIAKNPAGAKLLEQAHKVVDPNVATPILDAETRQNEPLIALQKKFDEYVAKTEKEKSESEAAARQSQFDSQWKKGQQVLLARGYTEDAIKKFEEQMAATGVTDHTLFVDAWEKRNPPPVPAAPSSGTGGSWNFGEVPDGDTAGDKFVKQLIETRGKEDYIADRAAQSALSEFRQAQRAGR